MTRRHHPPTPTPPPSSPYTFGDVRAPQWEDCKACGGDHWTKDHPETLAEDGHLYAPGHDKGYQRDCTHSKCVLTSPLSETP